jgi:protein-S-isoprenylcysteine O-methyltransferase Ste14
MALKEQMELHGNILFKYRGVLPIALLPFTLYFHYKQFPQLGDWAMTYEQYLWLCLGVVLFGQIIRFYTLGYVAPGTSGRNTSKQVADTFNSTGIYSIVRHPLYVGNFFMGLGVAMLSHDVMFTIIYVLLFWVYYERIMLAEESYIRSKFLNTMDEWISKTPTFIPSFSNFKKPASNFDWKKIIRQEKNGFVAAFTIFWMAYTLKRVIADSSPVFELNFYSIGLIASVVAYGLIKLLAKTKVLAPK